MVEAEKPVILQCIVTGTPIPEVKWYRGEEELKPIDDEIMISILPTGEAKLTILKPTPEDETVYRVRAVNKYGRAECRANVVISNVALISQPEILQAPRITRPLPAITAELGQSLTIDSTFESKTKPDVKWFKNDGEVIPSEKVKIGIHENSTDLSISKVTKKDVGKYEVRVKNEVGEARSSGSVIIADKDESLKMRAPKFVKPIQPQIVTLGEVVVIETQVESYPTSTFQWFFEDKPISVNRNNYFKYLSCKEFSSQHCMLQTSHDIKVITEENKSVLLVDRIQPQFAGAYTCQAENPAGFVTSTATINISEIVEETVDEIISPSFTRKLTPVIVSEKDNVNLTCIVQGKPVPEVLWYHNDKPIKQGEHVTISQSTEGVCCLAITEVIPENAGEYTCRAVNPVGEAICTALVVVESTHSFQIMSFVIFLS